MLCIVVWYICMQGLRQQANITREYMKYERENTLQVNLALSWLHAADGYPLFHAAGSPLLGILHTEYLTPR